MLDPKLIKVLSKIYKYEHADIDHDNNLWTYTVPKNLSKKQKDLFIDSGYAINKSTQHYHDTLIKKLRCVSQHDGLENLVANLLIKAVGSGFHRGIQPISSYYFARNLPKHDFEAFSYKNHDVNHHCKICGFEQSAWTNDGRDLYHLYIGYLNLYSNPFLILDLEEVTTFEPRDIRATQEDKTIFLEVIKAIEQADKDETLSALEKRLSKEKRLPNSNKSTRLRILWCFAELGILKNKLVADFIFNPL